MADIKSFIFNKPGKYFTESITKPGDVITDTYDPTNVYKNNSSSISFNQDIAKLVSTQQIDVDYSKFENHTFFNSAQVNVNSAFNTIVNKFPFDGTKLQQQEFIDSLTGFEKHVYDRFAKNVGYLNFSGSSYISVKDSAGANFPTLSSNSTGKELIDPENKSFTIEAQIYLPPGTDPLLTNTTQVIFQKLTDDSGVTSAGFDAKGFTLFLSASDSLNTENALLHGNVTSGSAQLFVTGALKRGQFNHVAFVCDKEQEQSELRLYINGNLVSKSEKAIVGRFYTENRDFLIGSGSSFLSGTQWMTGSGEGHIVEPQETFSGSIDEFRFFHEARTQKQINLYRFKSVFQDDNLRLYYKFNEPTGALGSSEASTINRIVLDSSGNSMHSSISNYHHTLRSTGSVNIPLTQEKISLSPVLFPSFNKNVLLNEKLLTTASIYDANNPNIITNLIPKHYFLEGEVNDGVDEIGNNKTALTGSSLPGSAKLGTTQILSSILFIWAKQFDELKVVLDSFKTLRYTDYNTQDNIPDVFLNHLLKHYGFEIPKFFSDSGILQFFDADNIKESKTGNTSKQSLLYIQNQLMRRFLANIQQFMKSRGTINGLKMLIRSMGIDPDTTLNIRFFDKNSSGKILNNHQDEKIVGTFLNITSSAPSSFITSSYLSGSRTEPGIPEIKGDFISQGHPNYGYHGYSNNESDGLFTSGSWTFESLYKFPVTRNYQLTQSFARLIVTGSGVDDTSAMDKGIVANLVALSSSSPILRLYVNSMTSSVPGDNPRHLSLSLTGANVFDGDSWNISFGRTRRDKINSHYSSSYFIRASKNPNDIYVTSSFFGDGDETCAFEKINSTLNSNGAYISIGNEQGVDDSEAYASGSSADYYYLNNTVVESTGESRTKAFDGLISQIRFWSKDLTVQEWKEHVYNKTSLGVRDPGKNFNFEKTKSGSFEKLRLDVNFSQNVTQSNSSGEIILKDFSQNNLNFSGFNFATSTQVINKSVVPIQVLSYMIDDTIGVDKIRARSFKKEENVSGSMFAQYAPQYRIEPSDKIFDDSRLSIEFSIVEALNKDIIKMFSTLDKFNDYVTAPEMMFSNNYHNLDNLKDTYFNRLTEKIYLKSFYKLFQYMDAILGDLIKNALPYKTKYFGTNLTVESHVLERSKVNYLQSEAYLDESEKQLPVNTFDDFNSSK